MKPLTDGERLFFVIRLSAAMDVDLGAIDAIQRATEELQHFRDLADDDSMGAEPLAMLRNMLGAWEAPKSCPPEHASGDVYRRAQVDDRSISLKIAGKRIYGVTSIAPCTNCKAGEGE